MKHGSVFNRFGTLAFTCIVVLAGQANTQGYKEYTTSSNRELLFEIIYNQNNFGHAVSHGNTTTRTEYSQSSVKVLGAKVTAKGALLIDRDGLHVNRTLYPFDDITDIRVGRDNGYTVVSFYTRDEGGRRTDRIRRGNRIEPFGLIVVDEDEFVRGTVFSVTGDVEIYGEVNQDVISLFGDVFVGPDAVVRGDIASATGRIDLARDATVYQDIYSGSDRRLGRRHRFRRFHRTYAYMFDINLDGTLPVYNRVDGLSLGLTLKFDDPDSLLPTAWAGGSYAFESKRWRYELGLEQTILHRPAIALGGTTFRRLISEDDWLLSPEENSVFAVLVGKDYKDYYEAVGASAYLRLRPLRHLVLESGYRYEETKWLNARRNLWSLFGGSESFEPNFGSVDSVAREAGIAEIDTSTNASLYGHLTYNTRDEDDPYRYSGYLVEGLFEWSSPDLDSDFDYTRYRLSVTRYQKLYRRAMAILRGVYGGSDGCLPMHRRFYLGGLGTLYGYDHKEFSGNYFWLTNVEYRIDFPHSDLAASVMWEAGQVTENSDFDNVEVKHSLGAALYIGSDFKIGLARRLDRSYDDRPEFFARFAFAI